MASKPPTQQTPTSSSAPPLWPAPVFVLGVAALVTVCLCRPLFADKLGPERDLVEARKILSRPDGDVEKAITLAKRVHDHGGGLRGEAALVLGIAHSRRAEKADPAHAPEAWKLAREFLSQAESEGVKSDGDKAALKYRIARVEFHTGGDLDAVIARLEAISAVVEAKAEAYDLLTRAYLRQPKPNLDKALEANTNLRAVPELSGPELASAQLTGGEILLMQKKTEEARDTLVLLVGKEQHATPAVLVRARLLLARCYQEEQRYDLAVTHYLAALKDGRAMIPRLAHVYYNLGISYRAQSKLTEAVAAWKECVRLAQGEEAQAASVVLAEIGLLAPSLDGDAVIADLTRAVADVATPAKWNNLLVDLNRACTVFEQAIAAFRQQGRYDVALRVLEPYSRLAQPPRALEWRAALSSEWARRGEKPDPTEERETVRLFEQAAVAFTQYAQTPGLTPKQVADNQWAAVCCHLSAGAGEPAARLLERLVAMDLEPARMGEAWYLLGEEYRTVGDQKKAETAYQESLKYVTRFAYLARYQLAMAWLSRGDVDAARDALKLNLSQLTWDSDAEATSQSLFALCNLLYGRGAYVEVVRHYEQALERYRDRFRDGGALARARYQLADSYYQLASRDAMRPLMEESMSEETRRHLIQEHRSRLAKAADEFSRLDAHLETPEGQTHLTAEERVRVPFLTAKCWFELGKDNIDKALAIYLRLSEKHKGTIEGLNALGQVVACHAAQGHANEVRQYLIQIEMAVEGVPAEYRKVWKDWLEEAKKGLPDEVL